MSSLHTRSSSGHAPLASTSMLPPTTPRRRPKRKSAVPLSSKQYDRMTKQLLQIQRGGSARDAKDASLAEADEDAENARGDDGDNGDGDVDDGDRHAHAALHAFSALDLNADAPADSDSTMALARATATTSANTKSSTKYWLDRVTTRAGQHRQGKGPDGIALAAAAAAAKAGSNTAAASQQAGTESFAHDATFMFNPLGRRVPLQASRREGGGEGSGQGIAKSEAKRQRDASSMPSAASPSASPATSPATPRAHLSAMPRQVQEALLIEDLLYVLMGIEGQWITFAGGYDPSDPACQLRGPTYTVDAAIDASLRDLALRILPLATCYTVISTFVDMDSALQYGTVTHALCAALREVLHDYESMLVALEDQLRTSPFFTLQQLWLRVHPMLHDLSIVYAFVSDVAAISHADLLDDDDEDEDASGDSDEDGSSDGSGDEDGDGAADNDVAAALQRERKQMFQLDTEDRADDASHSAIAKGGEILAMLWDRTERQSGDPRAHALFTRLFQRASQPYARILLAWITTGILHDAYDEFMVYEDPRVTYDSLKTDPSDIYWEQRYTLRDQNILAARERSRQGLSEEENARRDGEERDEEATGRGMFTGGAKIPGFLEDWKHKVLLAGKYLNVVRECGREIRVSDAREEHKEDTALTETRTDTALASTSTSMTLSLSPPLDMTSPAFLARIEAAYQSANTQLLHLLITSYDVVARLRSLKHYFFFSSSDFFSSFIEQAERELRKVVNPLHVRDSVKTRLQTHLGMVLGSSAVVGFSDAYKDDVKVGTALDNPYESLKRIANTRGVKGGAGTDAAEAIAMKARQREREREREKDSTALLLDLLEFDVAVKFPVSLVISRKNMIRWKFLHTILIQLKVTERQLADVWLEHQSGSHWQLRVHDHPALEGWKMRVFKLRYRMTFFVQNLLAFFTSEVIDPNWAALERKMDTAKTVDEFLKDHTDFLNDCRKECMLTDVRFVEFLGRLMQAARTLYENRARLEDHVLMAASSWSAAKMAGEQKPPELAPEMWRALEKQEGRWARNLRGFNSTVQLMATTDNPSALPLALRLQSA